MRITVFTPTYNRGYCINRLYNSLLAQTFRDFEWVVIDDGSTDDTEAQMELIIKSNHCFPIKYYKKENGGKHTAINYGIKYVIGDLCFIVDSDDWLPEDSLESIHKTEKSIPDEEKSLFAGVCGIKCRSDFSLVGSTFDGETIDMTSIQCRKSGYHGDKADVFYTSVLRNNPFPVFPGENFVTESIVWNQIASEGLKLRYFNHCVYLCEYLDDGLTHKGILLYAKNPQQWAYSIRQEREMRIIDYNTYSIQLYKFFLCEKEYMSTGAICDLLKISRLVLFVNNCFNYLADVVRQLKTRQSIRTSIIKELKNANT